MRVPYLSSCLLGSLLATPVVAQNRYTLVHPAGQIDRTLPIDLGGGHTFYASMVHYAADDSSHVELLWADPDQQVTNARSHRLGAPMTYLYDAARMGSGFVVSGSSDASVPFLLKTDALGDVQWQVGFPALGFSQHTMAAVLADTGGFRAYTSAHMAGGSYLITGDSTGSAFDAVFIETPPLMEHNTSGAIAGDSGDIVFGQGRMTFDPNNRRMFVMKANSSGALWAWQYDVDGASVYNEYVRDVELLSDGGILVVGHAVGSGAVINGYLLKLDGTGALLWCRKYTDASDALVLTGAIELAGGDLLIAAYDLDETLILLRLDPTGAIVAQHQLPIGSHQPEDFFPDDQGGLVLMEHDTRHELDADGIGCGFVTNTSVTSAAHVPGITSPTMINTPVTTATTALPYAARPPVLGWDLECFSVGTTEHPSAPWVVHPNPAEGIVRIGAPGQVLPDAPVTVLDAMGRVVFRGRYGSGIDVSALTPGAYCVVSADGALRARFVRR